MVYLYYFMIGGDPSTATSMLIVGLHLTTFFYVVKRHNKKGEL